MIESYLLEGRQDISDHMIPAAPSPIPALDGRILKAESMKLLRSAEKSLLYFLFRYVILNP